MRWDRRRSPQRCRFARANVSKSTNALELPEAILITLQLSNRNENRSTKSDECPLFGPRKWLTICLAIVREDRVKTGNTSAGASQRRQQSRRNSDALLQSSFTRQVFSGCMSHSVKLGSAAIVGVQFLTGIATIKPILGFRLRVGHRRNHHQYGE